MKILSLRALLVAGAACALALSANAQVIEFRATLNAAQVAAPNVSTSAATGSAVMLYDLQANTYDLIVSMTGLGAAVTGSALHEAPAGSNADALTQLGAELGRVGVAQRVRSQIGRVEPRLCANDPNVPQF